MSVGVQQEPATRSARGHAAFRTHLVVDPVVDRHVVTVGVDLRQVTSTLAVEKPEHHGQVRIAATTGAIDGNVVVARANLLVRTRNRRGGIRKSFAIFSFDVVPHVLGNEARAARLGHIVVAKGGSERHVTIDQRGGELIQEIGGVFRCDELARYEIAIKDH